MRWDKLFDDLENQLEGELGAEELDLAAEEERLRLGRLALRDRLRAAAATSTTPIVVSITGGTRLRLRPVLIGRDWFSADITDDSGTSRQCVVPFEAIVWLSLPAVAVRASLGAEEDSHPPLTARLGLAFLLRDLCRRRRAVQVNLLDDSVHGTIDRVGRDHLDLAVHEPGAPRRDSEVTELRLIYFPAIRWLRL